MSEKVYTITESQMDSLKSIINSVHKSRKRKKEEPKEEEESGEWTCAGRVWEDPVGPCQPGKRSNVKLFIMHEKKRVTVCKECKLARDRSKNKAKRALKKVKTDNE